jgi:hypothetical protein
MELIKEHKIKKASKSKYLCIPAHRALNIHFGMNCILLAHPLYIHQHKQDGILDNKLKKSRNEE